MTERRASDARSMKRRHALPLAAFVAGTIALFASVEPRQGQATLAEPDIEPDIELDPEPDITLGTLEGRLLGVRIDATPDGPRYSVIDEDGRAIEERLDLETLAARYPLLVPSDFYANEAGEPLGPLMIVPDDPGR